jgi:tetratricopeptide (TPR) repeat protein
MAAKVYKKDLLERYDATGDEGAYLEALPLYELAIEDGADAPTLDPDHIGPLFMSAFFLERIGRRQEAIDAWQAIIGWSEARGNELDTIWPKQELTRLQQNE